ncbi:MAG: glutathione S-transferase N-terminal domain-containing protein [Thalassovita sp.]
MTFPDDFPIAKRWPAKDPSVLQLYSYPTPNGIKVSIFLEETGLPYEAHQVKLTDADVKSPEFLSLNPNNKIPAIIDPNGPDGEPLGLWESGAILIYLADKTGKLVPENAADRYKVIQWVMFQMGGLGPMLGQLGYFSKFAGSEIEDPRPRERYVVESKRLLAVIEKQLEGQDWLVGDYSIADIAVASWLNALEFYGTKDAIGFNDNPNTVAYLNRYLARPAVQRGLVTPPRA